MTEDPDISGGAVPDDQDRQAYRISSPATLAAAIQDFRLARGLTQGELAAAIGAHRQYVHELEGARFAAQVHRLLEIFERLGVRIELVLEDGGDHAGTAHERAVTEP